MTINLVDVASWVIALFGLEEEAIYLSMDRTNWKLGKKDINTCWAHNKKASTLLA